jgi:hypothetical protein
MNANVPGRHQGRPYLDWLMLGFSLATVLGIAVM